MNVKRKEANHASRNEAGANGELWSEDEVEILMQFWGEAPIADIAATLGRTIEACNQKHFLITKAAETRQKAQKAVKQASAWTKGFTSLEEMGY